MRLFPTPTINRIGIGVIVFLVLVTISGELPLIFQCKPVRAAYDKSLEDFTCMSDKTLQNIQLYQAVLMFVIDVVIIVLPMPTIWKLQMPLQRRLSIIALFALGKFKSLVFYKVKLGRRKDFGTDSASASRLCGVCSGPSTNPASRVSGRQ